MIGGLLLGVGLVAPAAAQPTAIDSLGGLTRKLTAYEQRGPHEKLFLHLDRPLYFSGETMWLKVYAVDGTYSRPLALSSVAYVEVLDAANQPVLQGKVALRQATGQGSFLLPAALPAGHYTVRAYTSWMQNFSPDAYFHCPVTVINAAGPAGAGRRDSASAEARFFPEGGNLVQGLPSRVAFKVTDKAGRGVAATGRVLNQRGAVVARFQTLRLGMGSFSFTPAAGPETYTAVLTLPNGQPLTRQLPAAQAQGYVLHLAEAGPDHLTLTVRASSLQPHTLYLLAHSRQHVALATRLPLREGQATLNVNKSDLLAGVSHFTLFTAEQRPVCERLYFRPPPRALAISARPDKPAYTTRDKVSVQLGLPDQPAALPASLSMAVYRLDSLNAAPPVAIDRYLALLADVRGPVESPDYYFSATGPEVAEATDNLLLTQGWSRFRWAEVLAAPPKPFEFVPELYGPIVQARLTRAATRQPYPELTAYLAVPSRVAQPRTSRSDAQGLVRFEPGLLTGSRELVLQTDPGQDSTAQMTVLSPFSTQFARPALPAFGLSARFRTDYARRYFQAQVQRAFADKYRNRFAPEPVDSMAFFGKPHETYFLDKYTRFKVLEEVLREYVPGVMVRIRKDGFHLLVVDKVSRTVLKENPMVLLDGVPVFNINKMMAMNPLKIRKLEVVDSRYFQGPAIYDGIVSFSTYKGDLEEFPLDPRVLVQEYEGVQRQREFYAPRYDTPAAAQSRLPDLRNLLYWNPDITLTGSAARTLDFYTGDQAGRYLVVLQGLAANGLAGSYSIVLDVKPAL